MEVMYGSADMDGGVELVNDAGAGVVGVGGPGSVIEGSRLAFEGRGRVGSGGAAAELFKPGE